MAALNLRNLYATKGFSDIVIWAGPGVTKTKILAHKAILCTSPVLRELVQHAEGNQVWLPESPTCVDRMLQWMYTVPWVGMHVSFENGLGLPQELVFAAAKVPAPRRCTMVTVNANGVAQQYQLPNLAENIMQALKFQVIAQLETPQQVVNAAARLCENSFMGVLQGFMLERAKFLIDAGPASVPALWDGNVAVTPPNRLQPQAQSKKRPASLEENVANPDAEIHPAPKRVKILKKELPAKGGIARARSTKPLKLIMPKPITHCVCKTTEADQLLIQCDGCDGWYHPVCIGKSSYDENTVNKDKKWAMEMDVTKWGGEQAFTCLECDKKQG
ncbi:hypothetical protein LTR08_009259 [Meristemomyces frigidus]|nr:hypothetical protein LTR08_009259 [Meristemomyces frigidus]